MTTQPITIENGLVTIRTTANGVWLTQSQIADLFGVFTAAVTQISERFSKAAFCMKTTLSAVPAAETETSLSDTILK